MFQINESNVDIIGDIVCFTMFDSRLNSTPKNLKLQKLRNM